MKKLLLSLALLAGASAMYADELTLFPGNSINWEQAGTGYTAKVTVEGKTFTITTDKAKSTNNLIKPSADQIRVYKSSQITVSSDDCVFDKVVFTATETNYGKAQTVSEGWTGSYANLVYTATAATPAASITMTASANQFRIAKLVVDVADNDQTKPAGLAYSTSAVTVYEDKISEFEAPVLANPNNLDVTYTSSNAEVATVAADGAVTLTGTVGVATITAAFAGNDEYRAGSASYTVTVKAAPQTVASSVAATLELDSKTEFIVDYALTVGFVNNKNVFACDAAGDFIQLYGSNTLKVGDVIPAGWVATYELFNNVTPELTNFTLPETTEGTFTPAVVAGDEISNDLVNSVILIKDVTFDAATPATKVNFTGEADGATINFRNNYTLASVEAGVYDVTVVVIIYENAPSLYVVNYAPASGAGIADIVTDEAPAIYYNLHGVEVVNPATGLYIVRRGNTVTKELIRK